MHVRAIRTPVFKALVLFIKYRGIAWKLGTFSFGAVVLFGKVTSHNNPNTYKMWFVVSYSSY